MSQNRDPSGVVPEEDASGCLVLTEANSNFLQAALGTFLVSCLALGSLFFWYAYLFRGGAPELTNAKLRGWGFIGIAALPFVPFMVANLLYPPSLTIDNDGIAARNWGRTKRLAWGDIQSIGLAEVRVDRNGHTKTKTILQGSQMRISFMPLFGIAPAALADYINHRRNKASPGMDIVIGSPTRPQSRAALILGGLVAAVIFVVVISYSRHFHGIS